MKKILVPTDFSDNAMKAVTYAGKIAQRTGAVIYLLHVLESVIDRILEPFFLHEKLQDEVTKARLTELKSLKDRLADANPNLAIETELAKGTVTTSILDYAENLQADIIIMGTQGASGLKEVFLGSVTGSIIGRTKISILAVPSEYLMEKPDAIVFATNRYEEDSKMLEKIFELASLFNAVIHVVVFVDMNASTTNYYIYNHKQLNEYIGFLKKMYPDVHLTGELLWDKKFEETIEDYNIKNEVDIVAMITYPKSFWENLMKKSVTKKMAFHSKIPVLAIPAK
ncbi:MAG TPA: universal stress protein [Chitinophagaceae bacterium]|nr:universal stress protein [Chitinophagaceae bacterium]